MTDVDWTSRTVGSLIEGAAECIDHRATLNQAITTMATLGLGLLPVTENGEITGVLSERDIVWALARGADADTVWAADVMTEDPASVTADATLADAVVAMAVGSYRHLLVELDTGTGLISASDLLGDLATSICVERV